MDAAERSQFVGAYTKLLTNAWSDEAFAARVKTDPRPVLEEVGLSVPCRSPNWPGWRGEPRATAAVVHPAVPAPEQESEPRKVRLI